MKRLKFTHFLIAVVAIIFLCTTTQAQPSQSFSTTSSNADYVRALFVADQFLYAWKTRNTQAGIALLSPALKSKMSNDQLFSYISGTSSPSHAAFEVNSGKQLPDGRYAFAAKLYEYYYAATPEAQMSKCPQFSRIVLVKSGVREPKFRVGIWLVDELPESCELILR